MAARTAVVAGTATAVSGRVARKQASKYQQEQAATAAAEPAAAEPAAEPAAAEPAAEPPMPAPPAEDASIAELKELASLHDQGILTDEEFAAKKKQLLGI